MENSSFLVANKGGEEAKIINSGCFSSVAEARMIFCRRKSELVEKKGLFKLWLELYTVHIEPPIHLGLIFSWLSL